MRQNLIISLFVTLTLVECAQCAPCPTGEFAIASNTVYSYTGCTYTTGSGPSSGAFIQAQSGDITGVIFELEASLVGTVSITVLGGATLRNSIIRIARTNNAGCYINDNANAINVTYEYKDLAGSVFYSIKGASNNCSFRQLNSGASLSWNRTSASLSTNDEYYFIPKAGAPISLAFLSPSAYFVRPTIIIDRPSGGAYNFDNVPATLMYYALSLRNGFIGSLAFSGSINGGCNVFVTNIRYSGTINIGAADTQMMQCSAVNPCGIYFRNVTSTGATPSTLTIAGQYSAGSTLKIENCTFVGTQSALNLSSLASFSSNTTVDIRNSTISGLLIASPVTATVNNPHKLLIRDCRITQSSVEPVKFEGMIRSGAYILLQRNVIRKITASLSCIHFVDDALGANCIISILDNSFYSESLVALNIPVMQYQLFEMWNNYLEKDLQIDFADPSGQTDISALIINNTILGAISLGDNSKAAYSPRRIAACNKLSSVLGEGLALTPCSKIKRVKRCNFFPNFPLKSPRLTAVTQASVEPCIEYGESLAPITPTDTLSLVVKTATIITDTQSLIYSNTISSTLSPTSTASRTASHSMTLVVSSSVSLLHSSSRSHEVSDTSRVPAKTASEMLTISHSTSKSQTVSASLSSSFESLTPSLPTVPLTNSKTSSLSTVVSQSESDIITASLPSISGSPTLTSSQYATQSMDVSMTSTKAITASHPGKMTITASNTQKLTSTQSLIILDSPPVLYTPTPEAKAVTDTASVVAVASGGMSGGQLTTTLALLRMLRCGENAAPVGESLPVLVHPLRFEIPLGDDGLGGERGAIIGDCVLLPLAAAAVIYWPIATAVRLASGTDLATARAMIAWPSVAITPFVVLAEGIAECTVSLLAGGGAVNVAFAMVGALTLCGLAGLWVWCLWRLPLRRLTLLPSPTIRGVQWWMSARKEWVLGARRHALAGDEDDVDDSSTVGAMVEKHMVQYASFLSEKWLVWADLASLVLSMAVGTMEGIEPTSTQVCLSRAVAAVVLAGLQVCLGLLTLIPIDMAFNIAQAALTLLLSAVMLAAVQGEDVGLSDTLNGISVAIGLLGIAGTLVGFVQAHSKSLAIKRRKLRMIISLDLKNQQEKALLTPTSVCRSDLSIFEELSKKGQKNANGNTMPPATTIEMAPQPCEEDTYRAPRHTCLHTDDSAGRQGRYRVKADVLAKTRGYAEWHEAILAEADAVDLAQEQRRNARYSCSSFYDADSLDYYSPLQVTTPEK